MKEATRSRQAEPSGPGMPYPDISKRKGRQLVAYSALSELGLLSVELRKSSTVKQHDVSLCRPIKPQNFFISEGRESA